ncbi:class A sortase [Lactiplantibacillus mudanjiangensis]|uniref:Sortase [Lactobacillus plantarum subsp. plantarum ST-III] n=1 Tax=Lactiplantibacillus mudanjiangensis TaxID=1296538 RepID=A0A660E0N3_9LACO|nr:class A sortase [Lactiplantibacillus mudanjiangensis]VDG21429.1 sortase [Lactobacillus plantarum subsp. plantarum ST-III] [Lactiplantibacillus mudanjiangensis]VDG26111.1 sortase [Lactobacillus plantarum subsp. plantarum ST-III] [Lactiplantibacillus mudanjiangensis]VDG29050.1 sortase [Lactobacillus plantarum subsp. plantarum ST-III] [Lactiplantibacillus mudanjiangensis]VDG31568.1 sortase [Lactobacillus plantarum subsp. plantarum ST-III] [Lactiplantibacillus mudanjiangensis]
MPKKQHTGLKWLWRIVFVILIVISLALIFNEQIKSWLVSSYSPPVTAKTVKKNQTKKGNFNFSKVKSLDFQTVAKARMNKSSIKVIGSIAIPSVDLYLPIGKGVSNETLALAAGTLKADQTMGQGNYALAGHHMIKHGALFSPLYYRSKVGQMIYLSDVTHIYAYRTSQRTFIKATDVQVIDDVPGKKLVTLITCDKTGAGRLMIRGTYVQKWAFKQAPTTIQKSFTSHFNNKY